MFGGLPEEDWGALTIPTLLQLSLIQTSPLRVPLSGEVPASRLGDILTPKVTGGITWLDLCLSSAGLPWREE